MGFFGGGGGASVANMVGATSSAAGTAGLVPQPASNTNRKALMGDATFGFPVLGVPYRDSASGIHLTPQAYDYSFFGTSSIQFAANLTYFIPIFLYSGTISQFFLATRGNPPTTNTSKIHWALYKADGQYFYPKTLVKDAGGMGPFNSLTGDTKNTLTVNSSVDDGWHYIAISKDGTAGGAITLGCHLSNARPQFGFSLIGRATYTSGGTNFNFMLTVAQSITSYNSDASTYTFVSSEVITQIPIMGVIYS